LHAATTSKRSPLCVPPSTPCKNFGRSFISNVSAAADPQQASQGGVDKKMNEALHVFPLSASSRSDPQLFDLTERLSVERIRALAVVISNSL